MSRIDDVIADQAYILDSLKLLRDIISKGDCNTCSSKKSCAYCPKVGELVRHNCPFYTAHKEEG